MDEAADLLVPRHREWMACGQAHHRKDGLGCRTPSLCPRRYQEASHSAYAPALFCDTYAGVRCRSANHPDYPGALGSGSNNSLSAPFTTPSPSDNESARANEHFGSCSTPTLPKKAEAGMSRPAVEVADILREQGDRFLEQSPWLNFQQLTVLRAIARCRTAALGGHVDQCSRCDYQAISYNSCRNRHCMKCQAQARQRWLTAREREVLEVPYFHVVFTLPHELNALCHQNARLLYDLLFRASAATMLEVAANPKRLGARIGFISILHTWGQNLLRHPHVHCVVPAGGFSSGYQEWVRPKYAFFLPVDVLSIVFRAKFVDALRTLHRKGKLSFPGPTAELRNRKHFAVFLDKLFERTGSFMPS